MQTDLPFGNPDGSRSDITELQTDFVTFATSYGPGLSTRDDDLTVRVIVGPKGSGKTVYLRRLQARASSNNAVYADVIQQDVPTTSDIVRFGQTFHAAEVTEKWSLLWHRAILRSLVAHIQASPQLKDRPCDRGSLTFPKLLPTFHDPLSVYSQVTHVLNSASTEHQFNKYLQDPDWAALESRLSVVLLQLPPVCLFIDAVDEEYAHAPMYWMQCQKGLFYRVMRLLRDARLGGRLHVTICIRETVLASVLQSEHQTRYVSEPHIRRLMWSNTAIKHFLVEKIRRLDDTFLTNSDPHLDHIEQWLGASTIENSARKVTESLEQYLLRHTRLLPRDMVLLGNELSRNVRDAKVRGARIDASTIRTLVSRWSATFGREQLAICANQVSADLMPRTASRQHYSEVYTELAEYRNTVNERLCDLIREIGKDRFGREELIRGADRGQAVFEARCDPLSVLWQHGLLGYREGVDEQQDVFFSVDNLDSFALPLDRAEYCFHACLIDTLSLVPIGNVPVCPS